ncbi:MAG TPA: hypothetical protein VMR73_01550 [Candidatus Paceibacterota bacterium]|nr:hypothetical protein [Candidatus Paceibacterota bacterium]
MSNIASLILVIISVGAFFGYIDPAYMHDKTLASQDAQYNQALDTAKALILERGALLTKYNAFNPSDLSRLQTFLPDAVDSVRLIIELDAIAQKYGMRIRNFTAAPVAAGQQTLGVDNSPYGTFTFTFTTTASYDGFMTFLHALEQNLRLIDVVGITFSAPTTNSAYDFTVTINTYWLK